MTENKSNIKMQETYYSSSRENEEQQRRMALGYSCEVISEGSVSSNDDDDNDIEYLQTPHAATTPTTKHDDESESYPQIDINDPLRYFLELGHEWCIYLILVWGITNMWVATRKMERIYIFLFSSLCGVGVGVGGGDGISNGNPPSRSAAAFCPCSDAPFFG